VHLHDAKHDRFDTVTSKTIYFVAGEVSADNHGAALMRSLHELDANLRFVGRGGPQMKARAGDAFHDWINEAGVLGLWEVIGKYGYFRKQFRQTIAEISEIKPDAVVLIDYPGFNLRLARALRRQHSPGKTIYYISPQVWAWHQSRIAEMARTVDLMLCIFPFEAELYNRSGLRTQFVGHPMIDRLGAQKITAARDPNLVSLFPGSRRREVRKIFPVLMRVVERLRRKRPNLHFEVAAASADLASEMKGMLSREHNEAAKIEIKTGDAAGIMQRASAGIVASGSATLEAAYFRMPFVLIYKVAWLTYIAGRLLVRVPHLGMPNLLAGMEIVPEFIQHRARPGIIADMILRLIDDPQRRDQMIRDFDAVVERLGSGRASEKTALAIMAELNSTR
jgi:lipid-A-disaccharide synthase